MTSQNPPLQARSREKLERVLTAAEELLEEHLFEQLSMTAVAERAGVAVGTIYTRFASKEDLLPALFERHQRAVGPRLASLLSKLDATPELKERVRALVRFAVRYHRQHRGLLRALTMYVRAHPDSVPARAFVERTAQYRAVAEVLVGNDESIPAAKPVEEALFLLGVVNSVCREQVLFDDVTPLKGQRRSLAALEKRLAQMLLRDLTGRPS